VLLVALIGLLQTINQSPVNGPSHLLFTTWRLSTLNAVITWLFYAAVLYTAAKTIKTPAQLSNLLWVIFGVGVIVALMGTLQRAEDNTLVYGLRRVSGQPFGPFVNRDHGAMFLSMAGMCGLGLFFGGFRPLFRHQSQTKMFDLLAVQFLKFIMIVAVIAGIVKTGSRGGLHSFVSAAVFMGFVASGFLKKRAHKIAAWLALLLLLAGYGLILNKYKILLGLQDDKLVSSVTVRFSMYKSGWEMLKDFPVFGAGLGVVEHSFPLYAREDLTSVTKNTVRNVHSDWLQLFLQAGWLGGLIYLAGLFGALYVFYRGWLRCRSFTVKAVYGGALGGALAAMAHSFVDFGLQMPANALVFYALLGALASRPAVDGRGLTPHEEEDQPEPAPPAKKYANAAAVIAALLALSAVPQFVAWQYGQRAADAEFEDKIQLRSAALKWQATPLNAFRLGADYYNHALKYKQEPCAKFSAANAVARPYLRQAPLNADLNKLDKNLLLQLANCYNRELVLKGGGKPVPSGPPPAGLSRP
jgi:O-antigen ligase